MSKKSEQIKFTGIDNFYGLMFEGNGWMIDFDPEFRVQGYYGTIENKTKYGFTYLKGYGSVDVCSENENNGKYRKYNSNHYLPASIPKYIIKKIQEIALNVIHHPEYYKQLNIEIEKNRIKAYKTIIELENN